MSRIEEDLAGFTAYAPDDWLATLLSLHHTDERRALAYIQQSPYYRNGHWDIPNFSIEAGYVTHILGLDGGVDRGKHMNDQIQRRFMDIMNDIIHHFGLGIQDSRTVLMTESTDDEIDDVNHNYSKDWDPEFSTRPDLALLGQDARHLPRPLDTYESHMSVDLQERVELYRGCIAIGKVQRYQRRGVQDRELEKVATCARECCKAQPGRRFVYCFSFTHDTFRLFLFDRSGAVRSTSLNIHTEGTTFVRMVQFLANPDLVSLGFDPSIFWDQGKRYIEVLSGTRTTKYEVERVLHQSPSMFGRCTTCWSGRGAGAGQELAIIKDGWRDHDLVDEAEFLEIAGEGNVPGVARLILHDESFTKSPLTIKSLRQRQGLPVAGTKDRVFTRNVLEQYGPSIRHFTSGLHLLQIMRDAIHSHYLLVKADVLHRNICPDNILIGKTDAPNGQRGILIDLEKATPCERGKTPADKDLPIGTLVFRSVSSIMTEEENSNRFPHRHDFCDDLESFFWVLAWMIMVHNGPGLDSVLPKHCETVEFWHSLKDPNRRGLSASKLLYLANLSPSHPLCLTPYFSSHPVYQRLHDSFRDAVQNFTLAKFNLYDGDGKPTQELDFFPDFEATYGQVLSLFDDAILELQPKAPQDRSAVNRQPSAHTPIRNQPKPQQRRGKRLADIDVNLNAGGNPPAKRPRLDLDHASTSTTLKKPSKSKRTSRSSPPPTKVQAPAAKIPRYARPLPANVRRSERLKAKAKLLTM